MSKHLPEFYFALREDLKSESKFIPTKATKGSAGYDVRAAMEDRKSLVLRAGQKVIIPLGFRTFCPDGWYLELKPRSSSFTKKSLHCLYGTLDTDWEGQNMLAAQFIPDVNSLGTDLVIEFGDALGQIIPKKMHEVEFHEASNGDLDVMFLNRKGTRGVGGFGSTGR